MRSAPGYDPKGEKEPSSPESEDTRAVRNSRALGDDSTRLAGKKLTVEEMMVSLSLHKYKEKKETVAEGRGVAAPNEVTYTQVGANGEKMTYTAAAIGTRV